MLATFCLRLACGLACALLLLSPSQVHPRFYRVQFLTVLGLTALAAVTGRDSIRLVPGLVLGTAMACAFLGSVVWSLEGQPLGKLTIGITAATTIAALVTQSCMDRPIEVEPEQASVSSASPAMPWLLADELTSAALLGSAMTAMLMGHSYLTAPAMSLTPLMRLLFALFAALVARMMLAGVELWSWGRMHSLVNLEDETVLWLPLRWGLGFLGPMILGWMAWQSAKIRSTQSATGILYVVVIFCFLGELTSQLLLRNMGFGLSR